jgi:RNA polymerase sigma-70 factor (ECF subfamily)
LATDEELMESVAQGDPSALRELCARWERPLYRFLHRAADGRDTDDLYQETWLRVVRAARRFDPARRFSTWLFQIALNLARDLRRRGSAEPTDPALLDQAPLASAMPHLATDDGVDAAIDARRLLAALPEAQREVVVLRVLEDRGEEETATILDCPRGTVKSRLHHALARLATLARQGEPS